MKACSALETLQNYFLCTEYETCDDVKYNSRELIDQLVGSMLIKIQPDATVCRYSLQSHSTCVGCHSTHHQEY